MKKLLLLGSIAVCLAMMASNNVAIAQEDESTTVHITIKEDGKVMTDTTFELKEGQDPDMVKKMVEHMVGGDEKMMKKKVIIMQKDDEDGENVEVYVIKKGDKDVKVIKKKITVEVETDADADVEKEVEVEVEVKTEKK